MGPLEAGRAEPVVIGNHAPKASSNLAPTSFSPLPLCGGWRRAALQGFIWGALCVQQAFILETHQRSLDVNSRKALVSKARDVRSEDGLDGPLRQEVKTLTQAWSPRGGVNLAASLSISLSCNLPSQK